ncbi:DUF6923 family protein, partial [Parapedobacter deserti]
MIITSTFRPAAFYLFSAIAIIALNFLPGTSKAQSSVTFDTEYWLALPTTDVKYRAGSMFHISTFDAPATVTLSAPLTPGFAPKTINIAANGTGSIPLTNDEVALLVNNVGNSIAGTGVRVETNAKISIYYEPGSLAASPDLLSLKGGEALGTEFLVPMQQTSMVRDPDGRQGFLVLATEDNTTVTITPKAAITGRAAGIPFTITLQRGETYFAETPGFDPGVSGSLVSSDKLIAITIFSELMRHGATSADLGCEQIVPIKNIGTEYLIIRGYRTDGDVVYFTAVEDNTELSVNGVTVATLNATDTYSLSVDADIYHVQSSNKVTALHLSGVAGEESFSLLPAQLGCNGSNLVQVVRANNNAFYVNIASPTPDGFSVNGNTSLLDPSVFLPIPGTTWYYARVEVPSTLVGAGATVSVANSDPAVKFQMGVFHTNAGGARYGYFSSYSGTLVNFADSEQEVCAGQSVSFTPQIISSDPILSYSWTGPDGSVVSNEEVLTLDNVAVSNSGTYTLTIQTVVCSVAESVQLTVHAQPAAPSSGGDLEERATNPIQTLTAVATLPVDAPAGASIVWYDAATGGNVVASPTLNAIGTVTYYAETTISGVCPSATRTPVKLTILSDVEICGNGIDDDGNGVADCDDPACNPFVNYFANGSLEEYTECPDLSNAGTLEYAVSWKTSLPAPDQLGGQLLVNDPANGCVSPRPNSGWPATTNLPAGSDGVAWGGMHGGAPNQGLEDFQNTLVAPLPAGTYTFTFSAGYLVNDPYTAPGFFRFYGVRSGEPDFTTAHPLGDSPLINNAISSSNPTWREYSFTFNSTEVYDRIYMVAYSGPTGRSYLVFDGFKMQFNPPVVEFQNPLATCLPNAVLQVKDPDPAWVSYQWYMDGTLIPGATGATYQPTTGQLGVFTVSAVMASGCTTPESGGISLGSNCPVPFECNGSAYLVSSPAGTTPSTLFIVNSENPTEILATLSLSIPDRYNAIGYNFEDNLIYGMVAGDSPSLNAVDIVRIDGEGTVTGLGKPTAVAGQAPGLATWTNLPATNPNGGIVTLATGVVGSDNMFYTTVRTSTATDNYLAKVDLTTMRYTTVKLSGNFTGMADLAFSPYDGMLYGLQGNQLIRTNPTNGQQSVITPAAGSAAVPGAGAGGAWNDAQGRVYFYSNGGNSTNGGLRLYRYNPVNGAFENLSAVTAYPTFDATACYPTRMDKRVIMPAGGLTPGDVVEFEFSIYNSQALPATYEFEDVLTSADLSWVDASVSPASPGGGTVTISGNTLRISGITVDPLPQTGGVPLTFRVSLNVADNAAYNTCYTNQATIKTGNLTVYSDDPDTQEGNDPTVFCTNPCDVPAPVSGGNLQACMADLNGGKLTASATVPAGTDLVWYDAPTGGNVVADPSLSTIGTVTYYAAADDGTCISTSRTPVTLNVTATPVLDEVLDVSSCGPLELPAISGQYLSGNEAYYTAPNGGGTRYLPGDVYSAVGTSTLYLFDQSEALTNCQGSLTVAPNTSYVIDYLFNTNSHFQYPGTVEPAFFQGTASQQILHDIPGTPVGTGSQTYLGVVGDVSIGNTADCFGTEVNLNVQVTVTNQGPGNGAGYSGRLTIFNKATNQALYERGLTVNFPANGSMTPTVSGVVPVSDVLAGNIAILIAVETYQGSRKNWLLSDFSAAYQFLPESTQACSAEQSFELTINEVPAAPISSGNQQACISDVAQLTATATPPAGTTLIWYDAPVDGNVVLDPSLDTVGTVTYFAAADNGICSSSTRTAVTLSILPTPVLEEVQDTTVCGPFELPTISGENLTGNEAYYTAPNGGGTKYLPGDVISTPGTSTLYIFDQSEALANCQGSLTVAPNTSYTLSDLFDDTHFRYPGTVDPAFWQGTSNQQILYNNPGTPSGGIQTYLGIIGDVSVGSTADCFGSQVSITAQVNVANQGPGPTYGYSGRMAIFNKTTNQLLYDAQLPASMAAYTSVLLTVTGVVPLSEVSAGNIAIVIVVETDQVSTPKNWLLSNFSTSYQFLPESTQACAAERSFALTINEVPAAPTSVGNQQACISDVAQLTATATPPAGSTLTWYDAPVGGNAVTDPSLDTVGVVTYYAEADNGTCVSTTRTPVTLSIMESPVLSEIDNVVNCGPYELPVIQGEHLTGNEAYYTGAGGTGTKYLPGDVFSTLGMSTLYVYDATEASANCAGSLSVSNNTKLTQADMGGAYLYDVDNTDFWNGTASTDINYDPADPAWNGQTYKTIAGDINITGANDCFGTQVQITAKVTIVNRGPGAGNLYAGQLGIWHNETNETLYTTHLRSTPVGPAINVTVTGVVPLADLAAGKLSFIVSLETLHGSAKSWTVSGFEADYQFLPETTGVCSAERSFELTINETPAAPTSGGNQQACISDLADKLTATAVVPGSAQLVWYDAPVGGNVVTDPSLDAVGTVTYFAAADNGICESTTRTPVTLSITASPVLDDMED